MKLHPLFKKIEPKVVEEYIPETGDQESGWVRKISDSYQSIEEIDAVKLSEFELSEE